jgi:hypothetical protein
LASPKYIASDGAVDRVNINYGIDSRYTWGESTDLARVDVKTSGIPDAGFGLFVGQDIAQDQVFSENFGTILSETELYRNRIVPKFSSSETDELKLKVLPFNFLAFVSVLITCLEFCRCEPGP